MIRLIYNYFGLDSCKSCETLRNQLNIANHEKEELLSTILGLVKPEVVQNQAPIIVEPIKNKAIPWHVRQKALEEEDRAKAKIERRIKEEEKELDLEESKSGESVS